jgi:hypothetical protein
LKLDQPGAMIVVMPRRPRYQRWRPPAWSSIGATLALVAACSGSGAPDFFTGPPLPHGGTGGSAGKAPGSGGSSDAAGAGNEGGAPDGTGGTGAGEPAVGGTSGTAGSGTTGGSAGLASGGTPSIGGASGTAGDTATGGVGGTGGDGLGGAGGLAGSQGAGTGGADPTAGATGSGGSVAGTDGLGGTGGTGTCEPTEPSYEICDGVDNDCEDGIDGAGVCPDGCVGAVYDKHRYLLCHGEQTYTRMQAHSLCNSLGEVLDVPLDLARVETEDENDFLLEFLPANADTHVIWISATDSTNAGSPREGSWVWGPEGQALLFYEDDTVIDGLFAYWAEGEPDDGRSSASEDCGVIDPESDYHWDDRVCSDETEMFLCEQLDG